MLTSIWQRVLELPRRTRFLAVGAIVLLLLLGGVVIVVGGPEDDLVVADSGAGNEAFVEPPGVPSNQGGLEPGTTTPDGVTVGNAGAPQAQPVAPIKSSGDGGGGLAYDPASKAIEDEMNANLPQKGTIRTPEVIASEAPADVKYAGSVLLLWSSTVRTCLANGGSPVSCFNAAEAKAPGVGYVEGTLAGSLEVDVEFVIYRRTPDGTRVWLTYRKGSECRGYGSNFEKCSAW
jgi:hypothetical protein